MPIDITYKCPSQSECTPIQYTFQPGKYKVEVWGAQGGNISGKTEGGRGGYASGIIIFEATKTLYFFLGAG